MVQETTCDCSRSARPRSSSASGSRREKYEHMRTVEVLVAAALAALNAPALVQSRTESASVHVGGAVAHPLTLTAADLAAMPRRSVTASAHHLSGTWEGVEVRELLTRAGVPANEALRGPALATAVAVTGSDGYRVVFGIAEFDS